jgi:spore germination cell wall hydrolase CwlJ-like protein
LKPTKELLSQRGLLIREEGVMKGIQRILASALLLAPLAAPAFAAGHEEVAAAGIEPAELHCLALTIYFEARGEPMAGKIAVGHVVLNRVADGHFPHSICAVMKQGGDQHRFRCQFSFWCDGQSDTPADKRAWNQSMFVATLIETGMTADPTHGALWYHAQGVKPDWAQEFAPDQRIKIGRHIFYGTTEPAVRVAGMACRPSSAWSWTA